MTAPGALLLNNGVFNVATGAGYCVLPRNVKTQNTLTQAQITQSSTPSP